MCEETLNISINQRRPWWSPLKKRSYMCFFRHVFLSVSFLLHVSVTRITVGRTPARRGRAAWRFLRPGRARSGSSESGGWARPSPPHPAALGAPLPRARALWSVRLGNFRGEVTAGSSYRRDVSESVQLGWLSGVPRSAAPGGDGWEGRGPMTRGPDHGPERAPRT